MSRSAPSAARAQFATGDRIMFLKNERSLGVKNGTLGTVESVTAARMAVQLDDGRSVAFDVKDYAQIDHGYAATIHKAQGMTVDRAHVLATPGLDPPRRLCRAVAPPRQRGPALRPGRLRRSGQAGPDAVARARQGYGVGLRSRAPRTGACAATGAAAQSVRWLETAIPRPPLRPSARRSNRRSSGMPAPPGDIVRMRRLVVSKRCRTRRVAFAEAGKVLDAIRPDGARDLRSALNAEPALIEQAASGKTAAAIRAMMLESEVRIDTAQRADRFVSDWQKRTRAYERLQRVGDYDQIDRARADLTSMAKSLHRDPQLESLLQNRYKDLGIGYLREKSSQGLLEYPGLSRGRGLGL